ncbi:hypothetical protein F5Y00DRAFT_269978 [Daldinia vernicosa]|uniref:uncharacterized protein n=1 Tax=Daldinia vernicosa TaxID=114800 RepID=UPI0020087519|nr:uncharacterized protein F5Y00DRAFT_269978 [Daldinia vernicosa]KAI0848760.1 hypothetical protein F5Y00DRAFT_269978 [Daldinia vernicosa]
MDSHRLWDVRPIGSKRPSSTLALEDREVKKSRTQPHGDDAGGNIPDNELPLPVYGGSSFLTKDVRCSIGNRLNYDSESQVDISMGDASTYDVPTPSRSFEQSPAFTRISSLWDSQGSHFQGHASTLDVRSASQSEQSVSSVFQANEPLSQYQAESLSTESAKDAYSDYDTCFGVVLAVPTSSVSRNNTAHSVPVNLKPFGGTLMIYEQNSNAYAGILSNCQLVNALRQTHLKLDATLFISKDEDLGGINKTKMKKNTTARAAREYSIRIVVYGLMSNKEAAGDLLSDAGCFLQQPYATEVIPGVQYDNPHYLVRPGSEMPKLENLSLGMSQIIMTYHQSQIIRHVKELVRCFNIVINLPRNITHFSLEVIVNILAKVLLLRYSRLMFGDNIEGVPRVGENAPGVMKLAPMVVQALLVRKIDLEFIIWIWYCYLLILQTGADVYETESTHEELEYLGKRVKIFSPISKSCLKISEVQGHWVRCRVYIEVENFRGLDDDPGWLPGNRGERLVKSRVATGPWVF